MTKEEAEIKIKAVAYTVAAELGWQRAVELLKNAADRLQTEAWKDR